jgi:hypothetical protein
VIRICLSSCEKRLPKITLLQVGIPADREQYIHRLGRTGRKGKEGQGLLLLAPWEKYFLGTVKDLSIAESAVPPVDSSVETEVSSIYYLFSIWLSLFKSVFSKFSYACLFNLLRKSILNFSFL